MRISTTVKPWQSAFGVTPKVKNVPGFQMDAIFISKKSKRKEQK